MIDDTVLQCSMIYIAPTLPSLNLYRSVQLARGLPTGGPSRAACVYEFYP